MSRQELMHLIESLIEAAKDNGREEEQATYWGHEMPSGGELHTAKRHLFEEVVTRWGR